MVLRLTCKHVYHTSCLESWLNQNLLSPKCPNCNYIVLDELKGIKNTEMDQMINYWHFNENNQNGNQLNNINNVNGMIDNIENIRIGPGLGSNGLERGSDNILSAPLDSSDISNRTGEMNEERQIIRENGNTQRMAILDEE